MKNALMAGAVALVSLPGAAAASVDFPAAVKAYYDIETLPAPPPSCTLCHRDDVGGADTVTRPFGRTLLRLGAQSNSVPSLDGALQQVAETGADSDGDGVGDVEELRTGGDPNVGTGDEGDPLAAIPLPQTGCAFAPTRSVAGTLALLALVAVGLGRRRR